MCFCCRLRVTGGHASGVSACMSGVSASLSEQMRMRRGSGHQLTCECGKPFEEVRGKGVGRPFADTSSRVATVVTVCGQAHNVFMSGANVGGCGDHCVNAGCMEGQTQTDLRMRHVLGRSAGQWCRGGVSREIVSCFCGRL